MTSAMIAGTAEPWLAGWLSLAATGGALLIDGDDEGEDKDEDEVPVRADGRAGADAAAVPAGLLWCAGAAAGCAAA